MLSLWNPTETIVWCLVWLLTLSHSLACVTLFALYNRIRVYDNSISESDSIVAEQKSTKDSAYETQIVVGFP